MIFLQADAIELNDLFRRLEEDVQDQIDNFETHIVPIIADIDGFGNEEATYLLTKKMVEAGACAIKSKIKFRMQSNVDIRTESNVPHEDFLAKINAIRYAFFRIRS
jgi:isocitrate lyase